MTPLQTQNSSLKIDEAIDLLNEAARIKKDEFSRILSGKVSDLKETVVGTLQGEGETLRFFRDTIEDALQESEESFRESASLLDKEVSKNPWPYLGGAIAAGLLLGFILGKSKQ